MTAHVVIRLAFFPHARGYVIQQCIFIHMLLKVVCLRSVVRVRRGYDCPSQVFDCQRFQFIFLRGATRLSTSFSPPDMPFRRRPLTLQAPLDPSMERAMKQDHIICASDYGNMLMAALYLCKSNLSKERAEWEERMTEMACKDLEKYEDSDLEAPSFAYVTRSRDTRSRDRIIKFHLLYTSDI